MDFRLPKSPDTEYGTVILDGNDLKMRCKLFLGHAERMQEAPEQGLLLWCSTAVREQ